MAKNIYPHKIDLKALSIRNTNRQDFAAQLIGIEYRGYEVEQCDDGRKIVIAQEACQIPLNLLEALCHKQYHFPGS